MSVVGIIGLSLGYCSGCNVASSGLLGLNCVTIGERRDNNGNVSFFNRTSGIFTRFYPTHTNFIPIIGSALSERS